MRTEPPSPLASALARLRGPAGRVRRWLVARGTVARVGLLLLGLATLGAMGYLASLAEPGEAAWTWILASRKLSGDDVAKVSEALEAADIPHIVDPFGKVGVKPSRRLDAYKALVKARAIPLSLDDLSREVDAANPFLDTIADRERRETFRLEQILKVEIEGLDPVISSAHVQIHRAARKWAGRGVTGDVKASVYLKTEGGRTPNHRVVEGVLRFLAKDIPDLKPDAITVVDHLGRAYVAADDPSLKQQMQAHAHEEEWTDKIEEALRHIPDVGVTVQMEPVPLPPPPPEVPPAVAIEVVRPNGHVDLVDPLPPPSISPPTPQPSKVRANVWVRVPRSFYLLDFQSRSPGRQPTQDDLEPMRLTTERVIREAVAIHIPKEDLGDVKIAVIQDDLASNRPVVLPSIPEAVRPWTWMALSGAISAGSLAAVVGLVRLANRRPSGRPSRSAWRPGYVADGPGGPMPGPSERVRELIRSNPEAAAGVLQRWIGQGGESR